MIRATFRRTDIAFAAAIVLVALLYNPIFNYQALLLRSFTGGAVRAALSVAISVLLVGLIVVMRDRPANLPSRRSIALVTTVLMFGTVRGLTNGSSVREVFGDLFPLAELYLYVVILSWIIRDRRSADVGVIAITAWVGVVATVEVVLYTRVGYLFSTRVLALGCTLPRLDDFMPLLFFPVAIIGAALLAGRPRIATGSAMFATGIAITISFFRTIWLAAGVSLVALVALTAPDLRRLLRLAAALAVFAIATLAILASLPMLLTYRPVCETVAPAPNTVATTVPTTVPTTIPTTVPTTAPNPTTVATTVPTTAPTTAPTTVPTRAAATDQRTSSSSSSGGPNMTPAATTSVPVAVVTGTPPPFTDLLTGRVNPDLVQAEPASFGGRIQATLDMLRGIRENPLFGVGFGGSFLSTTSNQVLPLSSAPNYFTAITMELGIPGALVLLIVTAAELWRAARAALKGTGRTALLGRGSLAGIVAILVSLAVFPALLHWAIGPFSALLLRAVRFADPDRP